MLHLEYGCICLVEFEILLSVYVLFKSRIHQQSSHLHIKV